MYGKYSSRAAIHLLPARPTTPGNSCGLRPRLSRTSLVRWVSRLNEKRTVSPGNRRHSTARVRRRSGDESFADDLWQGFQRNADLRRESTRHRLSTATFEQRLLHRTGCVEK